MLDNSNVAPGKNKTLRCAIYTRKSHEEGLEQEFNSLDAQRESAEHYSEMLKKVTQDSRTKTVKFLHRKSAIHA